MARFIGASIVAVPTESNRRPDGIAARVARCPQHGYGRPPRCCRPATAIRASGPLGSAVARHSCIVANPDVPDGSYRSMHLADVRRKLHALEQRLPARARRLLERQGRPLLALNRRAVARGAALGVFFGIMVPLGQIPAAVLLAPVFRANALVSALATLVTNPLTFPPIWAAAYAIGGWILAATGGVPAGWPGVEVPGANHELLPGWLPKIAVGLVIIATFAALLAYHGVGLWWARATRKRWRRRAAAQRYPRACSEKSRA
jgi:uncharacterized protein (DUF2062 family)